MSRELPTGFATAAAAPVFHPVLLVELDWPSGVVRAWNGYGTLAWNGHDWLGVGEFGSISPISESQDMKANGIVLTLSGIPEEIIADALSNDAQRRPASVYIGSVADDGTFEAEPYRVFEGFIDVVPIEDNGSACRVSVRVEKELIDRRLQSRRSTHEDQQIEHPGDLFFEYTAALAERTFAWGTKTTSGSGQAGGGTVVFYNRISAK